MSNRRTESTSRRGRRRRYARRRPTILFVDDDPDEIGALVAAMRRYDVRVLTHYTGEQGYIEAMRVMPDLIVTDLRMPQGSGEMLLECLHRNVRTSGIPVIVLSGQRRADLPGFVQHLGAAKFLCKPVSAATLFAEIRRFVRLRPAADRTSELTRKSKPTTGGVR
jgi:DNA-binding response OmpR family regulator